MDVVDEQNLAFIEHFLLSFKELGGNKDGMIDYEKFKSCLKQKGACATEILKLIDDEKCVDHNNLNFFRLCSSLLATKMAFNILSAENGRVRNPSIPINTLTYTRRKSSSQASMGNSSADENSNSEIFRQEMRGCVFDVSEDFLSNQYHMEILENSSIEIYAKPVNFDDDCHGNVPFEILILQDKNKALVTSSSVINSEGYCAVKYYFKKGKYVIVPVVLNWLRERPKTGEVNLASLIDMSDEGDVVITEACERALKMVFDSIDLDRNGLLSQLEFDLFIQHTSGETAADEWSTIEDNFKMEDHQLTFDGFVELYKMVLQTDPMDVTTMFHLMGMNEMLEMQNAKPFDLFIQSNSSRFLLSPLRVASYSVIAEKGLCKMAVEQGFSKKVKNMNDLVLYTLRLPHRVTIVIQNQSHSKVRVRLDCTRSVNCRSHRNALDYTVEVPQRSSIVGHHLFQIDPNSNWNFECADELK